MLNKITINQFLKKTKEEIKKEKIKILNSKSISFYPIFVLYSLTFIFLIKIFLILCL